MELNRDLVVISQTIVELMMSDIEFTSLFAKFGSIFFQQKVGTGRQKSEFLHGRSLIQARKRGNFYPTTK